MGSTKNNNDNNIHKNHRQRLLKKASEIGFQKLEQHEILELMLFFSIARIDTNPIAHRLINEFKTIDNVLNATLDELKKIDGIGEHSAIYLNMLKNFVQYCNAKKNDIILSLDNHEEITNFCRSLYDNSSIEELYLLTFNSQRKLLKVSKLSEGISSSVSTDMRTIVNKIANTNCSYVILSHNHPSGIHTPSQNDIDFTIKIGTFLSAMGIALVDHIISAGDDFFSFRNSDCDKFLNY